MKREIRGFAKVDLPLVGYAGSMIAYRNLGGSRVPFIAPSDERERIENMIIDAIEDKWNGGTLGGPLELRALFVHRKRPNTVDGQYIDKTPKIADATDALLVAFVALGWIESVTQVASINVSQRYGDVPGIYINLREV